MNRDLQIFGTTLLLLAVVDLPWLLFVSGNAQTMVRKIQGSDLQVRYAPAAVVYIALAYLVGLTTTPFEAFKLGVAVYAVYDFTNLALFKNYDPLFAIADSLWGGVLLATVRYALNRIF